MKKFNLSLVAVLAMSTFAVAGGDIAPVEPVVETPVIEEVSTGGFYLGLAYSIVDSDISYTSITEDERVDNSRALGLDLDAIMLQAGYKFNDYVAVEGRYWIGLSDEAFAIDNDVKNRFDDGAFDAWGIYVKPMYPVTDSFDIYGLLGYGSASIDSTNYFNDDVSGISWGVGAAYSFTESVSLFADYVAFTEDTLTDNALNGSYDHDFDTINFGLTYSF